jgi:hypothetical protein
MDPQFRETTTSSECSEDIECTHEIPFNWDRNCKRSGENPGGEKYLRNDSFPTT